LDAGAASRFASLANVRDADADAARRLEAFQTQYRDRELATKLRDSTSAALAKLKEGEDALAHSRFEETLERLHTARELAGALGADPMLRGMAQVDTFLADFATRSDALRTKHAATMHERAEAESKRVAEGELTRARDLFTHHRDEEALAALSL